MVTFDEIRKDKVVQNFLKKADKYLEIVGYTEHGSRHATIVAVNTRKILKEVGKPEEEAELGAVAAYLHDIGNVISRSDHPLSSAFFAWDILKDRLTTDELIRVAAAIGNHDDDATPVNNLGAALIIADKADVHISRVRNANTISIDIHDRVNYAVKKSYLTVDSKKKVITLHITIDTKQSPIIEYMNIFMQRMMTCRKAAAFFKHDFSLEINGTTMV